MCLRPRRPPDRGRFRDAGLRRFGDWQSPFLGSNDLRAASNIGSLRVACCSLWLSKGERSTCMDRIRVLVADDEPAVRAALAELIETEDTLELVGTAKDAQEAIELAIRE